MAPTVEPTPELQLERFIAENPRSRYTFDGERGSQQSLLCRETGNNNRECITLQMQATKLFEAMQEQGFFCALPMEPGKTYMECTPIPK